jgi:hypothetical protein
MAEVPENSFFESSEDLLKFLRERADDIEAVVIPTGGGPIGA